MRMFKTLLLTFFVCCNLQKAHAQIGFDLNPTLLDCIMSKFECLSHTGIPIVDLFFGESATPHHNDESFCYAWLENWCSGPSGYPSAYSQCRDAKKQFYKKAKIQMGQWPSNQELEDKYHSFSDHRPREEHYFDEIENNFGRNYFTCTARQQYIWLKNRCGHTQEYNSRYRPWIEYKDHPADVWARIETNTCR